MQALVFNLGMSQEVAALQEFLGENPTIHHIVYVGSNSVLVIYTPP